MNELACTCARARVCVHVCVRIALIYWNEWVGVHLRVCVHVWVRIALIYLNEWVGMHLQSVVASHPKHALHPFWELRSFRDCSHFQHGGHFFGHDLLGAVLMAVCGESDEFVIPDYLSVILAFRRKSVSTYRACVRLKWWGAIVKYNAFIFCHGQKSWHIISYVHTHHSIVLSCNSISLTGTRVPCFEIFEHAFVWLERAQIGLEQIWHAICTQKEAERRQIANYTNAFAPQENFRQ